MRFGSVCSGIEAASIAWHELGWDAAWLAEVDVAASAVLAHRFGATAPQFPLEGTEKSLKRIRWGDHLVNWGDMTRLPEMVRSGAAEAPDILCGGTPCFTAGHMVLTVSGYKPIEDVRPGEFVATHKGRFRSVLRVGSKRADVGKWKAVGQSQGIVCTADHPFYVAEDMSRSTRINGKPVRVKQFGKMKWVEAKNTPGTMWSSLRNFEAIAKYDQIPQPHDLTRKETMRLIGWFLGDGWIREWASGKKAIILGLSEAKVSAFRRSFPGLKQADVPHSTCSKIAIGCTELCEWITEHFGSGADGKTIPGWLMSDQDRQEVLAGYIATDGCKKPNGSIVLNSVSERLSRGAASLAQTLGYAATVTKVAGDDFTVIEGRIVNQKPYFSCTLYPESESRKSHVANGLILRKVQSFEQAGRDTVFNIEVDEDNSFVLNGAIVHNCQGFSLAGLRGGLNDPRGQLTLSFVELANAIDDRRAANGQHPCAIFWENVPGVRSDSGNAFGHFLAALVGVEDPVEPGPRPEPGRSSAHWTWKKETREHVAKWPRAGVVAGPRRTVGWRSSDAQYFGLAQRRERLFVVASARAGFDPQVVLLEFDSLRRDSAPSREPGQDVAGTLAASTYVGGISGKCEAGLGHVQLTGDAGLAPQWWDGSPVSQTLDAVLHKGQTMPEKNRFPAVLQPVYAIQERAVSENTTAGPQGKGWQPDIAYTLEARHHVQGVAVSVALRGRQGGGTAELGDDLMGTLRASGGGGDKPHVLAVHGTQDPIVGVDLAHALGRNSGQENAVCVTGDITHALKAEGFDGSEDGTGRGHPITVVQSEMAVRRLMPVECERLMGFPDGHTLVPVGKGAAADGPRYKQLGNSWAVPCVTWIGRRLDMHLADLNGQIIDAVPAGETPAVSGDDALRIWMCVA